MLKKPLTRQPVAARGEFGRIEVKVVLVEFELELDTELDDAFEEDAARLPKTPPSTAPRTTITATTPAVMYSVRRDFGAGAGNGCVSCGDAVGIGSYSDFAYGWYNGWGD
jgi:hypothetical protein